MRSRKGEAGKKTLAVIIYRYRNMEQIFQSADSQMGHSHENVFYIEEVFDFIIRHSHLPSFPHLRPFPIYLKHQYVHEVPAWLSNKKYKKNAAPCQVFCFPNSTF